MAQKASDLIIPKLDELTKQFNEFSVLMTTQFVQVHEELNALKEKMAAAPKKTTTRSGTSKVSQTVSPAGKKSYNNKMIWWKDMFAAHYDQFVQELFTPELESDGFIAEAEEAMQDAKSKDKVGEARYKAMADYIWKTKIKPEDGFTKFRDAVFQKFEKQKNSSGDGEEATAEDNDDDSKATADAAEPDNDANNNVDDGDAADHEDEESPPLKAAPKKGVKAASTPAKAPAKPAAKGPAKTAAKGTTKASAKGAAKSKK